jgi:hypothetical protein
LTGNLTIPDNVTSIGYEAFYNCSGFTGKLTIPNGVTSIGSYAFYNCNFTTIYGYADSCAQKYAEKNNIPFEIIYSYGQSVDNIAVDSDKIAICAADSSTKQVIPYSIISIEGKEYSTGSDGIIYIQDDIEGDHFVSASADGYGIIVGYDKSLKKGQLTVIYLIKQKDEDITNSKDTYDNGILTSTDIFSSLIYIDDKKYYTTEDVDYRKVDAYLNQAVFITINSDGLVTDIDSLSNHIVPIIN